MKACKYFILFLSFSLLLACNQKLTKDTELPERKYEQQDTVRKTFHSNGILKSKGMYILGLKEGLHEEWSNNGTKILAGYYSAGKANGQMIWYHEKGALAAKGNKVDNKREGPWMICDVDENGFCIDAHFVNDKREGIWRIYHEGAKDKIWKEQTFKDDRITSEKCWDLTRNPVNCI